MIEVGGGEIFSSIDGNFSTDCKKLVSEKEK
jgi:hypothetical protein